MVRAHPPSARQVARYVSYLNDLERQIGTWASARAKQYVKDTKLCQKMGVILVGLEVLLPWNPS